MYQAFVFDLGDVLIRFKKNPPSELQDFIDQQNKTNNTVWRRIQCGQSSFADFIRYVVPSHLQGAAREYMSYSPGCFEVDAACLTLIQRCKKAGYGVYLLSNFSREFFEPIAQELSFDNLFDGIVVSYQVGFVKPEREIFFKLLERYALHPKTTVFVDDLIQNIHAAQQLGIHGIVWTDPSAVVAQFEALGVFDER